MNHSLKNVLSILLAFGVTSMAHADKLLTPAPGQMEAFDNSNLLDQTRATAPARTITHQFVTAPASNLKGVRVDTNETISNDHYLIGIEPSTVMAVHPETIPQGVKKKKTKLGANSNDKTVICHPKASPLGVAGTLNVRKDQDDYDTLCNQLSPCQDNLCFGNPFP